MTAETETVVTIMHKQTASAIPLFLQQQLRMTLNMPHEKKPRLLLPSY
jgi:hypothetical protein